MDVKTFLRNLSSNGITVTANGEKLSVSYQDEDVFQTFSDDIRKHKPEIMKHLNNTDVMVLDRPVQAPNDNEKVPEPVTSHNRPGEHSPALKALIDIPDLYRQEIRAIWNGAVRRMTRAFQKHDGLSVAEAKAVAIDVMTLLCNDSIKACKKGGSKSVAYVLLQAIDDATKDTDPFPEGEA